MTMFKNPCELERGTTGEASNPDATAGNHSCFIRLQAATSPLRADTQELKLRERKSKSEDEPASVMLHQ